MLAKARGFGLGITPAHQYLGQLPTAMRQAVLAIGGLGAERSGRGIRHR